MRVALLRSKPALRWSYEGFFLNEKKEVMRDEAMFEMWSSVSGGQASAAAPDGGGGTQDGTEAHPIRMRMRIKEIVKVTLLRSVSASSLSFGGLHPKGEERRLT